MKGTLRPTHRLVPRLPGLRPAQRSGAPGLGEGRVRSAGPAGAYSRL